MLIGHVAEIGRSMRLTGTFCCNGLHWPDAPGAADYPIPEALICQILAKMPRTVLFQKDVVVAPIGSPQSLMAGTPE